MANTVKLSDLKTIATPNIYEVVLEGKDGKSTNILVKSLIDFGDMLTFVSTVVGICIDENEGKYDATLRAFATKLCLLLFYTNIEIDIEDDDITGEQYEILYGIGEDNFNKIIDCIDHQQFVDINIAINDTINYTLQRFTSAATQEVFKFTNVLEETVRNTNEIIENGDIDTLQAILEGTNGTTEEEVLDKIVKLNTTKADDE